MNYFSLIISFVSFASAVAYTIFNNDYEILKLATFLSVAVILTPYYFKRRGNLNLACYIILLISYAIINVMTINTDGFHGPLPHWMLVLPLVASLLLKEKKHILVFGILGMISNIVFYYCAVNEILIPSKFIISKISLDAKIRGVIEMNFSIVIMAWAFKSIVDHTLFMMRDSSRRYENLLRLVVHDSATPLTIITNAAKKLETSPEPKKQIEKINNASALLNTLINQVRNLSSINSGKLNVELSEVSPIEFINKVEFMFSEKLKEKNIILEKEIFKSSHSCFLGDETIFLHQVMGNLISNAIKFSNENSKILIRVDEQDEFFQFSVKDHGIGIAEDKLPLIFDPNSRTSTLGTKGEKGTGFGLPLVKTFTTAMGGTLDITSSTNGNDHGTTFTIKMPKPKKEIKAAA